MQYLSISSIFKPAFKLVFKQHTSQDLPGGWYISPWSFAPSEALVHIEGQEGCAWTSSWPWPWAHTDAPLFAVTLGPLDCSIATELLIIVSIFRSTQSTLMFDPRSKFTPCWLLRTEPCSTWNAWAVGYCWNWPAGRFIERSFHVNQHRDLAGH